MTFAVSFVVSFVVSFAVLSLIMAVGEANAWWVWVKPPFVGPAGPMRFPKQVERQGAWRGYPV